MQVSANSMKVSIYRLLVDPEFYLYNYAEQNETSEFLIVNEELLEVAPFIDNRLEPYARGQFSIATRQLSEFVHNQPDPRRRQHYIFHHAFVCSTLLARCLAQSDSFFSLKEPQIIRRLSDLKYAGFQAQHVSDSNAWSELLNTHLGLLAKHYTHGKDTVIKASNVANNLMPDILEQQPLSRSVYMYCSLEEFLVSNLKKTPETQDKIPSLLQRVANYGDFFQAVPGLRSGSPRSFLQNCALLWLASNYNFLQCSEADTQQRLRTLDMADFTTSPRATLLQVCRFFEHNPSAEELDAMTSDKVMKCHSKDPRQVYDESIRRKENAAIRQQFASGIEQALEWIEPFVTSLQVDQALAQRSLIAD